MTTDRNILEQGASGIGRAILALGTGGISELQRAEASRRARSASEQQTQRANELAAIFKTGQPLPEGTQGAVRPPLSPQRQVGEAARLAALGTPGAEFALQSLLGGEISPQEERAFGIQEATEKRISDIDKRQQDRLEKKEARTDKIINSIFSEGVVSKSTDKAIRDNTRSDVSDLQAKNKQLSALLLDPDARDFAKNQIDQNNAEIKLLRADEVNRKKATTSFNTLDGKTKRVTTAIDKALDQAGIFTAGVGGAVLRGIPGSPARDLQATLDTILANLGFQELQDMRDSSKTGGAVGQLAVRELELMQALKANLEQEQSVEQLKANLNIAKSELAGSLERRRDAFSLDYGGAPSQVVGQLSPTSFNTIEEANAANLPAGTEITIGGRKAVVE